MEKTNEKNKKNKSKIKKVISAVVIAALLIGVLFYNGVPQYLVISYMVYEARVEHKDIKRLDLSSLDNIVISNDGQSIEYSPEHEQFDKIKKILKNKRVKVKMSGFIPWEGCNKIELHTGENDYILQGGYVNLDFLEETKHETVYLVLYDYSISTTNEHIYQVVAVSQSDYLKIFGDLIYDEQSDE